MAKYTTQVRSIVEVAAGVKESVGFDSIDSTIVKAIPKVFNFDFPIFDEEYRIPLCSKILRHYYTREICEETVGLWKLRLNARLNEIMPFYNKLYKSELLEFNPLYDVDYSKEYSRTGDETQGTSGSRTQASETKLKNNRTSEETSETSGTNNDTTTSSAEFSNNGESNKTVVGSTNTTENGSRSETVGTENDATRYKLYSDTPQNGLTGVDNEEYLTNATKETENSNSNRETSAESENTTVGSSNTKDSGTTSEEGNSTSNVIVSGENTKTVNASGTVTDDGTKNTEANDTYEEDKHANTTEEYLERVSGKVGGRSYSRMLIEYRNTFINIDMQVIDELSDLFFCLW